MSTTSAGTGAEALTAEDRFAIEQVLCRYALAVDTRQIDQFDDFFTADVTVDYGAWGARTGREALKDDVRAMTAEFTTTHHSVSPAVIRTDGNRVRTHCCVTAQHVKAELAPNALCMVGARYYDEFTRTEGKWLISRRIARTIWATGNPAVIGMDALPEATLDRPAGW